MPSDAAFSQLRAEVDEIRQALIQLVDYIAWHDRNAALRRAVKNAADAGDDEAVDILSEALDAASGNHREPQEDGG